MTDTATSPSPPQTLLHRPIVRALLIFVLAVIPFLPALHGQFTWDDDLLLTNSPQVRAWNGLHLIWNPFAQLVQYFPLTYTTFWLEHKLWGLDTTGYHLVNMLLQGGAAILLWLALKRLGMRTAWFAALLWAIHPVQVDSVAWISERKNTLSGLFYMLAAWAYLRFARIGDPPPETNTPELAGTPARLNWPFYALALVAFIAALLAKTLVCTFPAAMLIVLWWKRGRLPWRDAIAMIPFFFFGFALAAITAWEEHHDMIRGGSADLLFSPAQRAIIVGKNLWFYLRILACPYPIMEIYPRWNLDIANPLNYLAPIASLFLLVALFLGRRKIGLAPLAALLFFLVTISPLLGFLNFYTMHYSFVADHYQYLACLSVLVLAAEGAARLLHSRPQFRTTLAALVILLLMGASAFYSSLFQSNLKLWSWNVEKNPDAYTAQHNLGVAYLNIGNAAEGKRRILLALSQEPDDDNVQRSAGRVAINEGRLEDALQFFEKAIRLRPDYGRSYLMLGSTYERMGRREDALAAYRRAVELGPAEPGAFGALAALLKKQNQLAEAAKAYENDLYFDPGNMITPLQRYANLLLDMKRYNDAITQYQFILKYQSNNPAIWDNLAFAYHQLGQDDKAVAAKKRANELEHSAQ